MNREPKTQFQISQNEASDILYKKAMAIVYKYSGLKPEKVKHPWVKAHLSEDIYYDKSMIARAVDFMRISIDIDPNKCDLTPLVTMAAWLANLGRYAEGLAALEELIKIADGSHSMDDRMIASANRLKVKILAKFDGEELSAS